MSFRPPACMSACTSVRWQRLAGRGWFRRGSPAAAAAGTPGGHHQPRCLTGPGHDRRKEQCSGPSHPEPARLTRHRRRSQGAEKPVPAAGDSPHPCTHPVPARLPGPKAGSWVASRVRGALRHADADGRAVARWPWRPISVSPPAIEPGPPGSRGGAGWPVGPAAREAGAPPDRCAGTVPGYLAGALAGGHPATRVPGKTGHLSPRQPAWGQPGLQPSAHHGGPAIPVSHPAYRQGCQAWFRDWRGRGHDSPYTSRVLAMDLSCT